MAKLPDILEKKDTIKNMQIGDVGFIVPWAMTAYADGECYINYGHTFSREKLGTLDLKVRKVKNGFEVDTSYTKHRWEKNRWINSDREGIPVVNFLVF